MSTLSMFIVPAHCQFNEQQNSEDKKCWQLMTNQFEYKDSQKKRDSLKIKWRKISIPFPPSLSSLDSVHSCSYNKPINLKQRTCSKYKNNLRTCVFIKYLWCYLKSVKIFSNHKNLIFWESKNFLKLKFKTLTETCNEP